MAEMYGFRHDLLDCRPDAAITYLPDCDNADWESADERWRDTFLMKLMHPHEDSYGQCYVVFPPLYYRQNEDTDRMYHEVRISDKEFPDSTYIQTGVGEVFSSIDENVRQMIGVMIFKRLDWNTYLGGIA